MRAFESLVLKYQDRVYNVCLRLTHHHEQARDVVQDTFLNALKAIRGFEHNSSFFTWLFRIAVNQAISQRRRQSRFNVVPLDGAGADDGAAGQALKLRTMTRSTAQPFDNLNQQERRRAVAAALAELDEDHRAVLVLRDIESLDYQAIAGILDVPVGTVRSRLHRARLAIRDLLTPLLSDGHKRPNELIR